MKKKLIPKLEISNYKFGLTSFSETLISLLVLKKLTLAPLNYVKNYTPYKNYLKFFAEFIFFAILSN